MSGREGGRERTVVTYTHGAYSNACRHSGLNIGTLSSCHEVREGLEFPDCSVLTWMKQPAAARTWAFTSPCGATQNLPSGTISPD